MYGTLIENLLFLMLLVTKKIPLNLVLTVKYNQKHLVKVCNLHLLRKKLELHAGKRD